MKHTAIFRSPSVNSSANVADPSTVTVRIQNESLCDINVQDVSTSSSSSLSNDDLEEESSIGRSNYCRTSDSHHPRRVSCSRPTTSAASLPMKASTSDNAWDLDNDQEEISSDPTISSCHTRLSPQAPNVFITTSERLGNNARTQSHRSETSFSSDETLHPSSPTIPMVFLTDDVLLGSIRSLQNERQLCKLSIDYLIDATNMRPDELARKANMGAPLPCHCRQTHSRCTLTLEFDPPYLSTMSIIDQKNLSANQIRELGRTQLEQLFSAVNRFISKAQQENKRILIYGFELTKNSPLAVIAIQYLMINDEQLSLSEAMHRIHRLFPVLPCQHQHHPTMEKRFQDYLKQLDKKTFPRNFIVSSISLDGSSTGGGLALDQYQASARQSPETTTTTTHRASLTSATTVLIPVDQFNTNKISSTRSAWDI